ncbi:bacteriohemerythrin [Methanocaldococcus indicus]|uniref:bacteriohemerythrin n=1 Tax=Methanocaldococcus indicus TaxID=213231 RepID=UPI003C6D6FFD
MYLKWSEEYEMNIKTFDEEHKFLLETVNNVFSLILNNKKDEAKNILINHIIFYADKHFKHEEKYMELHNYPDYENHKKIHDIFVNIMIRELDKIKKDDKELMRVVSFLIGWLESHIKRCDKKFGFWLKKNNVNVEDNPFEL